MMDFGSPSAPPPLTQPTADPPTVDPEQLARVRRARRKDRTGRESLVVNPSVGSAPSSPSGGGSRPLPNLSL